LRPGRLPVAGPVGQGGEGAHARRVLWRRCTVSQQQQAGDQQRPHFAPALPRGAPTALPSAAVADTYTPPAVPSRSGLITTVSCSPAWSEPGRQPLRYSWPGEPISTLHSFWPAGPFTSSWMKQCGLVHWKALTVPCSVTVRVESNMAPE